MEAILIFVLIVGLFFYLKFRHKKVPEHEVEKEKPIENRLPKIINSQYDIIKGRKSKVKYYYYPSLIFDDASQYIYRNIIVKNLLIEEPFHTTFTTIVSFLISYDDCIKSETTQVYRIDGVDIYKVYSVKELIFTTLLQVHKKVVNKYSIKDVQIILLATLLYKIDLLRVLNNVDYSKLFLDKFEDVSMVIKVIDMIKNHDAQFEFVNDFFKGAKKNATEFPYENSEGNNNLLEQITTYKIKNQKLLFDFDTNIVDYRVQ